MSKIETKAKTGQTLPLLSQKMFSQPQMMGYPKKIITEIKVHRAQSWNQDVIIQKKEWSLSISNGEEEIMFLKFMGKIHTQSPLFHHYPMKGAPEKSSLEGKIHRVEFLVQSALLLWWGVGGVGESLVGVALRGVQDDVTNINLIPRHHGLS